jgi:hypothetical protein
MQRYYKILIQLKEDTDIKNKDMITINLTAIKNILKLVMLAILTYLLLNITNNYNITTTMFQSEDTSHVVPNYIVD